MYPFRTSICGRTSTLSAEGGENYNWSPLGRVRARHVGVGACILNFAAPVFSYYFVINYSWGNVGWRFLVFLFPVWSFGISPQATGTNFSGRALCAEKRKRPPNAPHEVFRNFCVDLSGSKSWGLSCVCITYPELSLFSCSWVVQPYLYRSILSTKIEISHLLGYLWTQTLFLIV